MRRSPYNKPNPRTWPYNKTTEWVEPDSTPPERNYEDGLASGTRARRTRARRTRARAWRARARARARARRRGADLLLSLIHI